MPVRLNDLSVKVHGMALSDIFSNLQILIRWLHVLLGILWIGNLYFFDFVLTPLRNAATSEENAVASSLILRAVEWIRWSALLTVILGVTLLIMTYFYVPGKGLGPSEMFLDGRTLSARAVWIFFGMAVAMVMFFNIWFVAAPALKKLLLGRAAPEDIPFLRRRTVRSIRTATVLSGPMLFGMLAPAHSSAVNFATLTVALLLGSLILWCTARI